MSDIPGLAGKSALVAGASPGLGRHFAKVLAPTGAVVTLAARRKTMLEEAASAFRQAGGTIDTARLDVTDAASVAGTWGGHLVSSL